VPNLVKLSYGDLVLGLSQFLMQAQLPHKMTLYLKVVKK